MIRRTFIKLFGGASAGLILPLNLYCTNNTVKDKWGKLLPERELGSTGKKVTMLGVGGFHIGRMDEKKAQETIETAIEGGIRFFDSAESYQDGGSENKLGKLLVPKYRDELFLMTKTRATDAKTAEKDLHASLRRLNTDVIDLWQVHAVRTIEDANNRIDNGVWDVFLKAKKEGKVKHIGFSGHTTLEGHQQMINRLPEIETCQMPVNIVDPSYNSYIKKIMPRLVEKKIAVLAMKTLAGGGFFGGGFEGNHGETESVMDIITMKEAIHFAWSLPVSTLITGPKDPAMLQEKIDLAWDFTQLTEQKQQKLISKVARFGGTKVEYYKE